MLRREAGAGFDWLVYGREPRALALKAKTSVGVSHYPEQKVAYPLFSEV